MTERRKINDGYQTRKPFVTSMRATDEKRIRNHSPRYLPKLYWTLTDPYVPPMYGRGVGSPTTPSGGRSVGLKSPRPPGIPSHNRSAGWITNSQFLSRAHEGPPPPPVDLPLNENGGVQGGGAPRKAQKGLGGCEALRGSPWGDAPPGGSPGASPAPGGYSRRRAPPRGLFLGIRDEDPRESGRGPMTSCLHHQ